MTPSRSEHWLDQLATRLTRRQALKAALAGASLTLPIGLLRAAPARASASEDCTKGCQWTADNRYRTRRNKCRIDLYIGAVSTLYHPVVGLVRNAAASACLDQAVLINKADAYDCLAPGCAGFNPKAPGGPCDSCKDSCCACQASPSGYICCIYTCNDPDHNCCPSG